MDLLYCQWCGNKVETGLHVVRDCPQARRVGNNCEGWDQGGVLLKKQERNGLMIVYKSTEERQA